MPDWPRVQFHAAPRLLSHLERTHPSPAVADAAGVLLSDVNTIRRERPDLRHTELGAYGGRPFREHFEDLLSALAREWEG